MRQVLWIIGELFLNKFQTPTVPKVIQREDLLIILRLDAFSQNYQIRTSATLILFRGICLKLKDLPPKPSNN